MRTFKCAFSLSIVWHTQTTVTPNCSCNSFVRSSNCEPTVRAERIERSLISFVPNCRITMSGENCRTISKSQRMTLATVRPPTPCQRRFIGVVMSKSSRKAFVGRRTNSCKRLMKECPKIKTRGSAITTHRERKLHVSATHAAKK